MTPAELRSWRFYAESLIEQAIAILDAIDGDADLEDDGDGEPSLASPADGESQVCWCAGCDDDREWSYSEVEGDKLQALECDKRVCG